jgi:hypothetical protein
VLFHAYRPIKFWSLDESPCFRFVEVADIYTATFTQETEKLRRPARHTAVKARQLRRASATTGRLCQLRAWPSVENERLRSATSS